jgi:invasion protein IalB
LDDPVSYDLHKAKNRAQADNDACLPLKSLIKRFSMAAFYLEVQMMKVRLPQIKMGSAAALAAAVMLMGSQATQAQQAQQPAQGSKPAAAAPAKAEAGVQVIQASGPQPDWVKACGKESPDAKENCITTRDLRTEAGGTLVSVGLREVKGDPRKLIVVAVPPGVLLPPGMRLNIDGNQPLAAQFTICFPNNCFAEAVATDAVLGNLKKGNKLVVNIFNQQAKQVAFAIDLAGFGKAYDGPAIDPKVVEEEQKRLQDELQKRAEEARKKLIEQGQGGASAPKQ